MSHATTICPALIMLALCSCGNRPQAADDLQPGGMDSVAAQAEGIGRGAGNGRDPILDMGMIAMDHWVQPSVPVIKNARAIHAWFYPQKLGDGRSLRDGFYAYHVIEDFSWGMWDAMHREAINLQALGSIQIDRERGGLVVDPAMLPPDTPLHIPERASMSRAGDPRDLPYTPADGSGTDVVIVDENVGSVTSFRTNTSPMQSPRTPGQYYGTPSSSGVRTGPGEIDLDAVRGLIQRAQQQAGQMSPADRPLALPSPDGGLTRP